MPRIVYIEDEPDIFELVRRWIEEDGENRVDHAADGAAGLALIEAHPPDLILLDIRLGEFSIDGWEVVRRLKSNPATRSIPVMTISAHAQFAEHRTRALAEGCVDHISKPFDYDTIIDRVTAHLTEENDS